MVNLKEKFEALDESFTTLYKFSLKFTHSANVILHLLKKVNEENDLSLQDSTKLYGFLVGN